MWVLQQLLSELDEIFTSKEQKNHIQSFSQWRTRFDHTFNLLLAKVKTRRELAALCMLIST